MNSSLKLSSILSPSLLALLIGVSACVTSTSMEESGYFKPEDAKQAKLDKDCKDGKWHACGVLVRIYAGGNDLKKFFGTIFGDRVKTLLVEACKKRERRACDELVSHLNIFGTEKEVFDAEMKVCENGDSEYCINHYTSRVARGHDKKARTLAKRLCAAKSYFECRKPDGHNQIQLFSKPPQNVPPAVAPFSPRNCPYTCEYVGVPHPRPSLCKCPPELKKAKTYKINVSRACMGLLSLHIAGQKKPTLPIPGVSHIALPMGKHKIEIKNYRTRKTLYQSHLEVFDTKTEEWWIGCNRDENRRLRMIPPEFN